MRIVVSRLLFMCVAIGGCHHTHLSTREEVGCGVGAYPGQPVQRRAARWPEPMLGIEQHAALHVEATDVATGRAAVPLNIWMIQATDTLKARTNAQGAAEFSTLTAGPAEVHAWFFNYVSTSDSITVRTGFRDSVKLRLGRTGNECLIVPDTGRRARRRPTGP